MLELFGVICFFREDYRTASIFFMVSTALGVLIHLIKKVTDRG